MANGVHNKPWSAEEVSLIVADYFAMLQLELAGKPYSKAARNRELQRLIGRSEGSIEFKHQNISAVLYRLGELYIKGYKPLPNYQRLLVDAVADYLNENELPDAPAAVIEAQRSLVFDSRPPFPQQPTSNDSDRALARLIRRFDPATRDERNRKLGTLGEQLVFDFECRRLSSAGRSDLASQIRWISRDEGDGAGFDILSFEPEGLERLLEVKTTRGDSMTPFFLSENERAVSEERSSEYRIVRVYDIAREPKAFELRPPLGEAVRLSPVSYRASFR